MQFAKLRLTGFKSFVDATELAIVPGMTGIVGPNGCGKSNLVEALRWAMGENSAKRMRGSEMDDVIFGGTTGRPSRNIAEVVLELDNGDRTAPAAFNQHDRLEISRRIERGNGSDYRINGKSVRARDVQLLFQDNSSGAHSPALVSQGRVGALVNAKPTERRLLLEEAAGITGLHSRRHEAELRLRAAEENLTRLDDVITAMEGQLAGLKKQARQAARYRNLSDRIRKAEAAVLHLRWVAAKAALATAHGSYQTADEAVRQRTVIVSRCSQVQTAAAADLPPLRQAEAEAAARLQRLTLAREGLAEEEQRLQRATEETERRLAQIERDKDRERSLAGDADDALKRLDTEAAEIEAAREGEADAAATAQEAVETQKVVVDGLEQTLATETDRVATVEAERQSLGRQVSDLAGKLEALTVRQHSVRADRDTLAAELADSDDAGIGEKAVTDAEAALAAARTDAESAETARQQADAKRTDDRRALEADQAALAKLTAEADALQALLGTDDGELFPPLIDAVRVAKGYETAFAAALGEAVMAPLDEAAPVHWRTLPDLRSTSALPESVQPLAAKVKAPAALSRCLAHVGLVDDAKAGASLAGALAPGQILVTRDGGLWRWDGYSAAEGAPTAVAVRLQQRNRLAELETELSAAKSKVAERQEAARAADEALTAAIEHDRLARQAVQVAYDSVSVARDAATRLARETSARQSRLAAATELLERLGEEHDALTAERATAEGALAALPDGAPGRQKVAELRAELAEARAQQANRQSALDQLARDAQSRKNRLASIEAERASWRQRADGAGERIAELQTRADEARTALDDLRSRPAALADRRTALFDEIGVAEKARSAAADALAEGEGRLAEVDRALKTAEAALTESREAKVRAEAAEEAARTALNGVVERIAERLQVRPEGVAPLAEIDPDAEQPEEGVLQARLDRLLRERDNVGPVNLRAEAEAAELDEQIAGMVSERQDLEAAISRLRQGISQLNREARERLLGSFEQVNTHFSELFVRLFGGGKAHLSLTEADDPLNAGLEIFASPPGKRLQHLSLLSGGEQALTAIAVLFAVFLTNPAPICVLDEVDAPLDDANVDRFCTLVEEMARDGTTRFMIITHHRMTMARVDRLFGVTMPEQGVSQLVSVDLQDAVALRKSA
ncbi:MAG: chromosome segregation protein SMC [Pseudomonadota bacterium]